MEELFAHNAQTVFQQIGDVNQAISAACWSPGKNFIRLDQSLRFGNNHAEFLNKFQVDDGGGVLGTRKETKKYLIVYDEREKHSVLGTFVKIIKSNNIETDGDFYAISHMHKQLKQYSGYSNEVARSKAKRIYYRFENDIEYVSLLTKDALQNKGSNFVYNILFALLFKHYKAKGNTWWDLKEYLRTSEHIDAFRKLVINASRDILQNGMITDFDGLKNGLNEILGEDLINFSNSNGLSKSCPNPNQSNENKFSCDGFDINIGTIHSVKGQTHHATLLFSNNEYGKQDIQHVLDYTTERGPKYKRLIYVAASRPKHLFALAIEKTAYDLLGDKSLFQDFDEVTVSG